MRLVRRPMTMQASMLPNSLTSARPRIQLRWPSFFDKVKGFNSLLMFGFLSDQLREP